MGFYIQFCLKILQLLCDTVACIGTKVSLDNQDILWIESQHPKSSNKAAYQL